MDSRQWIGLKVSHEEYGDGVITKTHGSLLYVRFGNDYEERVFTEEDLADVLIPTGWTEHKPLPRRSSASNHPSYPLNRQPVRHSVYGQGIVVSTSLDTISVRFKGKEAPMTFIYPDCFRDHLVLDVGADVPEDLKSYLEAARVRVSLHRPVDVPRCETIGDFVDLYTRILEHENESARKSGKIESLLWTASGPVPAVNLSIFLKQQQKRNCCQMDSCACILMMCLRQKVKLLPATDAW